MVTFYLKSRCSENDIAAIVSYLATITELELLTEAVEIVKHMIETPGDNQTRLFQMLAGKMALQTLLSFSCYVQEYIKADLLMYI